MRLETPASFVRNDEGNVAIIFCFALTLMFGAVGGAIDFARIQQAKAKAQNALDSATLAGGRTIQITANGDITAAMAAAVRHYDTMKPAGAGNALPTFSVIDNGTAMRGTVNLTIATPLLAIVGWPQLQASIQSETVIAAGGNAGTNLEISLMLDMTGSMSGQKIDDLKDAAKDLVDIVVWDDQGQYTSKVALAPFSTRVNVGNYIQNVSNVLAIRSFGGNQLSGITCVTERTGAEALTDAPPNSDARLSANSGDNGNAARDNINNYSKTGRCTVSRWNATEIPEILPLSSNKTVIKDRISSLPASGATAGSLGTAWAWYLLSPRWNSVWQGDGRPAPYSDLTTPGPLGAPKLMKVAVLMSDGIYNTFGGSNANSTEVSNRARALCNNMKAAGIKVYTVGFQLGADQLAVDTLKACASRGPNDPADSPSYFFNAASGDELRGAFRQIALQLSKLRLRM